MMSDEHKLDDWENLLVVLLAIVGPFFVAFKSFQKAVGKCAPPCYP